jgi:hypothetical protein
MSKIGEEIGDEYERTGYKLVSFERKTVEVPDPALGGMVTKDVSELVIQHKGEDPIKLVLGQVAQEKEPVAVLGCRPEFGQGRQIQVRRGQRFECNGTEYIVVDITRTQVIIKDAKTEAPTTLKLEEVPPPSQP